MRGLPATVHRDQGGAVQSPEITARGKRAHADTADPGDGLAPDECPEAPPSPVGGSPEHKRIAG